jgi:hypothetical protein
MLQTAARSGNPDQRRSPIRLHPRLDNLLLAYATAASAAGVTGLALAPPAQGKIVYTPAHQKISGMFNLDLNHDGVNDFQLYNTEGGSAAFAEVHPFYRGNMIWGTAAYASALPAGRRVGRNRKFRPNHYRMASIGRSGSGSWSLGPWRNVTNRYLGLEFFSINGDVHYGWARLNLDTSSRPFEVTLTGYAYETVPNQPIITGKMRGSADTHTRSVQVPRVAAGITRSIQPSLGSLAYGARGVSVWRRRQPTTGRE